MNALILLGVFVLLFAIFESIAVAIGFVTDVMLPKWSMLIFLATTAAAVATAWPRSSVGMPASSGPEQRLSVCSTLAALRKRRHNLLKIQQRVHRS